MLKKINFVIISSFVMIFAGANLSAQVPSIVSVTPTDNFLGAASSSNITVTFDIDMDGSSFDITTFIVSGSYTGNFQGAYFYDSPSKTVTFDPNTDFVTGEVVSIVLTTAVQSSISTPLASSHAWSFVSDVSSTIAGFDTVAAYIVGSQPHGLTSADLNNDGLPDVASAVLSAGQVSVLINDGIGGFAISVNYSVGSGVRSVAAADVNRDGFLDLISANGGTNTISVLINNGDGTFASQAVYTTGSSPHFIAAADYDGDGYVDIATANYTSDNASVLINNGDGTFPTHTEYAVGSGPLGIYTADLDGDNDFDIVTANRHTDNIGVLFNNGDGTFATIVNYAAGDGPRSVFVADFNSDGDLDMAIANEYSNTMSVFQNNGSGSFTLVATHATGGGPHSVTGGDLDGDDDIDLAVCNIVDVVSVYSNNGAGVFSAPDAYAVGNGSIAVVAADLNGIGKLNLITSNFFSNNISVLSAAVPMLSLNLGSIDFIATDSGADPDNAILVISSNAGPVPLSLSHNETWLSLSTSSGTSPLSVTVSASITGLAVGTYIDTITINSSDTSITNSPLKVPVQLEILPVGSLFEVVSESPSKNSIGVLSSTNISVEFSTDMNAATINDSTMLVMGSYTGFHNGAISYDSPSKTATFDPNIDFKTGELVTVVLTSVIESSVGGNLGSGYIWTFTIETDTSDGTFPFDSTYAVERRPHGITSADLNGDGHIDVVTVSVNNNNISVLFNTGNGTLASPITYNCGTGVRDVVAVDVDGDSDLDLVTANGGSNNISVLLNNGDGTFASQIQYTTAGGPHFIAATDFNGDGHIDIATANYPSDNVSVLLNNGDGTFGTNVDYPIGDGPLGIYSADLDNDGDLDLVTANRFSQDIGIIFNSGDGSFSAVINYAAADGARSVFAADFDGDGYIDLASANEYAGNMSVFLNNGDGTFPTMTLYTTGSGPHSVIGIDFDGDADLDLAVGNLAANSIYIFPNSGIGVFGTPSSIATGGQPIALSSADYDGNGILDLAVTNFTGNSVTLFLDTAPPGPGDSLVIPAVAVLTCESSCENGIQPVELHLTQPIKGASIPISVPDGIVICSVSVAGLVTESWDILVIDDDKWEDSGFIFVLFANTSGELLPAGISTVFNIYFGATSLCQTSYFINWDTALAADPSRQLKLSDTLNQVVFPFFDSQIDATEILGHEAGDMNGDNSTNILDLTTIVDGIFRGGGPLCQINGGDVNADCDGPDIADLTYYVDYLFRGGEAPLCGCL